MRPLRESTPGRAPLALLLLLVPALLGGCGGSPTLARVGSQRITVTDFEEAARGNAQQYPGSSDSAKTALLDDLVRRTVLLEQGTKLHLVPDSTLERLRRQAAERLAVEALTMKLVPQDVPVSDAEAKELYQQRGTEAHLQLIFSPDQAQATQAMQAIERGEPFADVARRTNNPSLLPPDGDLGFRQPGAMVAPIDDWLRAAPPGKVMGPAAAPGFGWFVARVVERRPAKQEPFELTKPSLVGMIRVRKQRALQQKAYNGIRDQYRIAIEPGGAQDLFARLQQGSQPLAHPPGSPPVSAEPTPADAKKVVGHYDGSDGKRRDYTLADALTDLLNPAGQSPDITSVPVLRQWMETQLVQRALKSEAERRHMAEEPDVVRRAREQANNLLLQQVYNREISGRVARPTPEDVRAAYQRHASQLVRLDEAKVLTVTLADSAGILALARSLTGPGSLRAAAARTPGARVAERELRFPTQDPSWQGQLASLMSANPGDPRGPMRTAQGWVLYELVSKQQVPQPYEQLEPQLQHALEAEAAELTRDRVLSQYTDSLRRAFQVEIYKDRLKRVPWPVLPKRA